MARLPIPNQDARNWGPILNEFLEVAHNEDGTLKAGGPLTDAAINAAATTINLNISRLRSAYVDVRTHGASTASADNTAAIQAALNAAAITSGRVYVPYGIWTILAKLIVPKGVTLFGDGARFTIIQAGATFPINATMVQLGAETTQYEHDMWVEDIQLDANERPGVVPVETRSANEPSGLRRTVLNRYRGRGVYVHTGGGFVANCFTIEDCELFASVSVTASESILFSDVGLVSKVVRTTVSNTGSPLDAARPSYAVRGIDAAVFCDALHVEQHVRGTYVTLGANNKGSLAVVALTGHSSVDALVYITDTAPHTVIQAVTNGSDDVVVNTLTGYTSVGLGRYAEAFYTNRAMTAPAMTKTVTTLDHTVFGIPDAAGEIIRGNTAGGQIYLSIPTAVGQAGRRYTFKRIGASTFSIYPQGGQFIDGVGGKNITTNYGSITLVSDGTGWLVESQVGTIT